MVALGRGDEGRSVVTATVRARGVPALDDAALRALAHEATRAYEAHRGGRSGLTREESVRRAVRRKVEELSGSRPAIEILAGD